MYKRQLYSKTKQFIHRKHSVGMEDTGHYMINLTNYLLDKKFTVKYINPRATCLRRKELGISAKNDRKDALLIAEKMCIRDSCFSFHIKII